MGHSRQPTTTTDSTDAVLLHQSTSILFYSAVQRATLKTMKNKLIISDENKLHKLSTIRLHGKHSPVTRLWPANLQTLYLSSFSLILEEHTCNIASYHNNTFLKTFHRKSGCCQIWKYISTFSKLMILQQSDDNLRFLNLETSRFLLHLIKHWDCMQHEGKWMEQEWIKYSLGYRL